MDHSFSLGASRQHHHNNGTSPQQYSSTFGNSGSSRNNINASNSHNHNQQQQLLNSVFGSGALPSSLFSRSGPTSNFMQTAPQNHFNFPLRSNGLNGRGGSTGNGHGLGGNSFNRGRGNHHQSHANNGSRNRNQNQSNVNQNLIPNSNDSCTELNTDSLPQYRIYRRGDTIPGISSPSGVLSIQGNEMSSNGSVLLGRNTSSSAGESLVPNSSEPPSSSSDAGLGQDKDKDGEVPASSDGITNANKGLSQQNKTPVSIVSDIARFHGLTVEYRLFEEDGPPHNPTFFVKLLLGLTENYVGQGTSIKRAQHAAATEALSKTTLTRPAARTQPKRPFGQLGKRPNWALIQLTALANDLKEPISIIQQPVTISDPFKFREPPSIVSIHVGERTFTQEGPNFNAAKNLTAMVALKAMMKVKQEVDLKRLAESSSGGEGSESMENKSPISVVHEMAMKRGLTVTFEVAKEEGPPHSKTFTVLCSVGTNEHVAEGQGPTKQAAKKAASDLMIKKLSSLPITTSNLELVSLKSMQRGLFRKKTTGKKSSTPVVKDLEKQTVSPISRLIQIAHIKKYKEPEFSLISSSTAGLGVINEEVGPLPALLKVVSERDRRNIRKKKPIFTMEVIVGPHSCRGTGPNKKAAKNSAADAALVELGYGPSEKAKESNGAKTKENIVELVAKEQSNTITETLSTSAESDSKLILPTTPVKSVRQAVPGLIILTDEVKRELNQSANQPTVSSPVAQKEVKLNSSPSSSAGPGPVCEDDVEKLRRFAERLDTKFDYTDFPQMNGHLSVITFGQFCYHGIAETKEKAKSIAVLNMMEELSKAGMNGVKPKDTSSE